MCGTDVFYSFFILLRLVYLFLSGRCLVVRASISPCQVAQKLLRTWAGGSVEIGQESWCSSDGISIIGSLKGRVGGLQFLGGKGMHRWLRGREFRVPGWVWVWGCFEGSHFGME